MVYYLGKLLFYIFFKITGGVKIYGIERVKRGPLIVAANHQSLLDPSILMIGIPRRIIFLAASYLFEIHVIGLFLKWGGAVPVNREKGDFTSFKKSIAFLQQGKVIGFFPEGRVSLNGCLGRLKPGCAYLALKTGTPVLPVAIRGSRNVLPVGSFVPHRGKITVNIGNTLYFPKKDKIRREDLVELNERLEKELKNLLDICK